MMHAHSQVEPGLPDLIEVEPVHTCNLRCIMCHVSYEKLSKKKLDVDRTLEHLEGVDGRWMTIGSMYEPMAHPQFLRLAQGLSDRGMKMDLTTNGTLFTPENSKALAGLNFKNVTVSFDGARPETYEYIREGGDYGRALDRIDGYLSQLPSGERRPFLAINNTLMRRNMAEVPEAVDLWDGRGFDHMGCIIMVLRDGNEKLRAESPEPILAEVNEHMLRAARRVIEGGLRITLSSSSDVFTRPSSLMRDHPNCVVDGIVRSSHPGARHPWNPRTVFQRGKWPGMHVDCRSPFTFARINYNGDVILCYMFKVGNIYKQPFLDIWYGKEAQKIREGVLASPNICYGCDYYRFCIKAGDINYDDQVNFQNDIMLRKDESSRRSPVLLKSIGNYNLVGWFNTYYALPQALGPIDLRTAGDVGKLPGVFVAGSFETAEEWIWAREGRNAHVAGGVVPQLRFEGYKGFNVIQYDRRFFGLAQEEGAFDVAKADAQEYRRCVEATSVESTQREVDRLLAPNGRRR
jgi:radical SAM protein with 4Fe4S-binding SPASM domain